MLWDILRSCSSPAPWWLWVVGCGGGVSGEVGVVVVVVVVDVVIGRGGGGAEWSEDSSVGEVRRGGICRGSAEGRPWPRQRRAQGGEGGGGGETHGGEI